MKNVRVIKNNSGFSLVELMVVVAIIGILATVAIPSVNKYMLKARQAEAKTNLAAIYSANKAFAVEYNGYHTMFGVIGYAPEGQLRYNVGFSEAPAAGYEAAIGYTATLPAVGSLGISTNTSIYCPIADSGCAVVQEANVATFALVNILTAENTIPTVAAPLVFTASAQSALKKVNVAADIDTWTINQTKTVTNTVNGID
ncbi:MAG: type IV pilin protein [Pseudobdellovibrionaceae bacterium]